MSVKAIRFFPIFVNVIFEENAFERNRGIYFVWAHKLSYRLQWEKLCNRKKNLGLLSGL